MNWHVHSWRMLLHHQSISKPNNLQPLPATSYKKASLLLCISSLQGMSNVNPVWILVNVFASHSIECGLWHSMIISSFTCGRVYVQFLFCGNLLRIFFLLCMTILMPPYSSSCFYHVFCIVNNFSWIMPLESACCRPDFMCVRNDLNHKYSFWPITSKQIRPNYDNLFMNIYNLHQTR